MNWNLCLLELFSDWLDTFVFSPDLPGDMFFLLLRTSVKSVSLLDLRKAFLLLSSCFSVESSSESLSISVESPRSFDLILGSCGFSVSSVSLIGVEGFVGDRPMIGLHGEF